MEVTSSTSSVVSKTFIWSTVTIVDISSAILQHERYRTGVAACVTLDAELFKRWELAPVSWLWRIHAITRRS